MKDIIIGSQRIKKEITLLVVCFAMAFFINIAAIIIYQTPWMEVFTQVGYVVILTISFYLILLLIRFVMKLFSVIFRRKAYMNN